MTAITILAWAGIAIILWALFSEVPQIPDDIPGSEHDGFEDVYESD